MPVELIVQHSHFDKGFDPGQPQRYHVSILLMQDGYSFSIADNAQNGKMVGLEWYCVQQTGTPIGDEAIRQLIGDSLRKNNFLTGYLHKRTIFIDSRQTTLVPEALMQAGDERMFYGFNHPISNSVVVLSDHISAAGANNLFGIDSQYLKFIDDLFGSSSVHHASSVLLEVLLNQFKNQQLDDKIFVHIRPAWFEVVYIKNKQLQLFNSFEYKSREDLIYYLLFVMDQMGLNPEATEAVLLGEIERESQVFEVLYRYIRHIGFGRRIPSISYSYVFDELPGHQHFTILNSHLCEL